MNEYQIKITPQADEELEDIAYFKSTCEQKIRNKIGGRI